MKQLAFSTVLLAAFALSGCAALRHPKPPAPAQTAQTGPEIPPAPAFIGKVSLVNEDLNFVLIEPSSTSFPQPGTALKCMRNGEESAILAVSAERNRRFVSADIVKGTPQQGDEVYQ